MKSGIAMAALLVCIGCREATRVVAPAAFSLQPDANSTAYTTRLGASDAQTQAIVISQTVYPATRPENRPNAVVIAPQNAALAFTAMHRINPMLVRAPLLYLDENAGLSDTTLDELKRLGPLGFMQDGNVQVYLVGSIPPGIASDIISLGYRVREFSMSDPAELAEVLDRWSASIRVEYPSEIVASSLDENGMAHGLGALSWNACRGRGFAWVNRDSIPPSTIRLLKRRTGPRGAIVYLTGDEEVISEKTAKDLSRYGLVRRIAGSDAAQTSVMNARYRDYGTQFSWWLGRRRRGFDWGEGESGGDFLVASNADLLGAIAACGINGAGRQGPLLLVQKDHIAASLEDYLAGARPLELGALRPLLNHAWIIGDERRISWEVQKRLHLLLMPGPLVAGEGSSGGTGS